MAPLVIMRVTMCIPLCQGDHRCSIVATDATHQVESLRLRFAQTPGLPFAEVLATEQVRQVLEQEHVQWRDSVYTPLVTTRLLLSQAVDADPSCQQAVDRLLAERAAQGAPAI